MKYIGWRYHTRFSQRYDTLDEAIRSAATDCEYGFAAFECIENDDGTVALDKDALRKAVREQLDRWDAARENMESSQ